MRTTGLLGAKPRIRLRQKEVSVNRKGKESASRSKSARGKTGGGGAPGRRLRPGQLDGLVLAYMKRHKAKLPLSPTAVAHGIKRSSGAVGNCLGRLE
jgi:hypothetical protein